MSSYAEKLKDPRWQKKRLEILERDNFTCLECADTKKELHVHHRYYLRNHDPWDYENDALVTLCMDCHEDRSLIDQRIARVLGRSSNRILDKFAQWLEHFEDWEKHVGKAIPEFYNIELALVAVDFEFRSTWNSYYAPEIVASKLSWNRDRLDCIGIHIGDELRTLEKKLSRSATKQEKVSQNA